VVGDVEVPRCEERMTKVDRTSDPKREKEGEEREGDGKRERERKKPGGHMWKGHSV
jgi:hypothetical protein